MQGLTICMGKTKRKGELLTLSQHYPLKRGLAVVTSLDFCFTCRTSGLKRVFLSINAAVQEQKQEHEQDLHDPW